MKRWLNIFRQLIAILLIFQVSAAYALPTEVHLNLCLGFDGHVDISQEYCASDASQVSQQLDLVLIPPEDHHIDCLDVDLGCVSSGELQSHISGVRSTVAKISKNDPSLLAANYAFSSLCQISQASSRTSSYLITGSFPPSHLDSLRSTILLI